MKKIFKNFLLLVLMFFSINLFFGQTSGFNFATANGTTNNMIKNTLFFDSLLGIDHAHASSLADSLKVGGPQPWVTNVWDFCLSLINIALIGVLIYLAVVNILHIQYENYQLKKILLPMVIFVLLANFSLFFSRAIIELGNALSNTFFQQSTDISKGLLNGLFLGNLQGGAQELAKTVGGGVAGYGVGIAAIIFYTILGIILSIILFLIFLVLAVIMYVRAFVILALAAVSPLAYAAAILPQTQGFFKQWWTWFLRWVFMGPLILLVLKIASMIGGTPGTSSFFSFIAIIGMMILAIMVPWIIGGQVLGKIPGLKGGPGSIGSWATKNVPGISHFAKPFYKAGMAISGIGEAKKEAFEKDMNSTKAYYRGLAGGGMGLGGEAERDLEQKNQADALAKKLETHYSGQTVDANTLNNVSKKSKNPYVAAQLAKLRGENGTLKQDQLDEINTASKMLKFGKGQKQKFEQQVEQAIEINRKYHVAKGQIYDDLKNPFDNPGELGAAKGDIKSYKQGAKYDSAARKTLAERAVSNLHKANTKITDLKDAHRPAANEAAKAFDELSNMPDAVGHAGYGDLKTAYEIDNAKFNAGTEAIARSATVRASKYHVEKMVNSNIDIGKLSKSDLQEYKKAHNALKEKMAANSVNIANHSSVVTFMKAGGIVGDKRAEIYAHNFMNNADNLNRPDIINRILKRK